MFSHTKESYITIFSNFFLINADYFDINVEKIDLIIDFSQQNGVNEIIFLYYFYF